MDPSEIKRLDQITAVIHQLLNGKPHSLLSVDSSPNDEITQLNELVNRLAVLFVDLNTVALNLFYGKIDTPIDGKLTISSSLKNLQATLKHLTWQTSQVAKGDFTQKVDFLGDFFSPSIAW